MAFVERQNGHFLEETKRAICILLVGYSTTVHSKNKYPMNNVKLNSLLNIILVYLKNEPRYGNGFLHCRTERSLHFYRSNKN